MKNYTDNVLKKFTKEELIFIIHNLLDECNGLKEMNDNQFNILKKLDNKLGIM